MLIFAHKTKDLHQEINTTKHDTQACLCFSGSDMYFRTKRERQRSGYMGFQLKIMKTSVKMKYSTEKPVLIKA
jgi:hypothetical protein